MSKQKCNNTASHKYTWPGKDESFVCLIHCIQVKTVAEAMGMYLQMILLKSEDHLKEPRCCESQVEIMVSPWSW